MAKRTRSGEISGISKCDQHLSSCAFEEENWSPCVAWVVGRQPEDFLHIEALNVIVQTGVRKLFSVITKEQLCIDVRELGDPKNRKAKELPPYSEICEACKTFLDIGEPVPTPLMAKLIKWKMLISKEADLKKQVADTKTKRSKSATEKKKGKDKDSNKEKPKSPKKGDKKSTEGQHAKEGSKMKKRGEDDEEHKYIDDEPEDGAQRYFIVTGFHDPYLFQFLETINVNVNCIISVTSQDFFRNEDDSASVSGDRMKVLEKELKVFWRDVLPLLQSQPDTSTLHDIAKLDYEVSYLTVPSDPQDTEQRVTYSSAIFEDIALLLYNLIEAKRLYRTYMDTLNVIHVPVLNEKGPTADNKEFAERPSGEKGLPQVVDMRYYNDLMNTVPNESVSLGLIMHCMLEQVVATEQGIEPLSEQAVATKPDKINTELSAYLGEVTAKLGLTAQELEALSVLFDLQETKEEKSEYPKVININDGISIRTNHLKPNYGFNAEEVERKMLQLLPVAKLCEMPKFDTVEAKKKAARFQELFHFCSLLDLTKSEVDHALKQFVFECMELTKCDRNGFPLQKVKEGLPQQPIPWDDPYPYFKSPIPTVHTATSVEEPSPDSSVQGDKDEQDEETAALSHAGQSTSSVHRPKHARNSEAQRNSCIVADEKPILKIDVVAPSEIVNADPMRGNLLNPAESQTASLRFSHSNSVRFDVPSTPRELEDLCPEVIALKDIRESMTEISDSQQRNLNSWCFAEHHDPDIFLQVLQEATYYLPYVEVYHANREETVMLILHNPYNRERQNNSNWHNELHSNTGFRNYLENTVESIQDWIKMKEGEYKAARVSREAASVQRDEEDKQKALEKAEKKGKRSPTRSGKIRSPGLSSASSLDVQNATISNPYVRQGSIKALQAEQMRLANEEEEKERVKTDKTRRSSQKIKEKQEKEKDKPDKPRKSFDKLSQGKQNSEKNPLDISMTEVNEDNPPEEKEYPLPFFGYDSGNKLLHMLGATSTLFPSDGGTIQTERTEMIQGSTTIRSAVKKDGHIFVVHIINPREDMNLPEDYAAELDAANEAIIPAYDGSEKEMPKDRGSNFDAITSEHNVDPKKNDELEGKTRRYAFSQFGSVTAHLSDGMILAVSQFGSTGESYLHPYEPPMYIQSPDTETQLQVNLSSSPSKSKTKGNVLPELEKEKNAHTDESVLEESGAPKTKTPSARKHEFQELHVTCPDGLTIKYFLQSSADAGPDSPDTRQLLVKQSYPFKTSGIQSCESIRNKYIQSEVSRIITPDGHVIKNMADGSVEVLGSDGTISVFTGTWSYSQSHKPPSRGQKPQKSRPHHEAADHSKTPSGTWTTTYPNGERLRIAKEMGIITELPSLPVCVACDPETNQVMCTRDDQVIVVTYPDGGVIVEHADGTRISTYYKDITVLEEVGSPSLDSYIQTMKFIKVECPAFATVEFNTATSENLTVFGNGTNINVFSDGYYMFHHSKGGRIEIDTEGTMTYFPQRSRFREQFDPGCDTQYVIRHNADVIVETVDPTGNVFNVRSNGETVVIPAVLKDLFTTKSRLKAENSKTMSPHDNHAPRFFIIHDDGSGTELLRYDDVGEYLLLAEQNPAAAVLIEEIPNHVSVNSITVLKPYLSGISEKWLKKYDQECIVPQGLRCRDLKTIPAKEYKKSGPVFGTNVGKGLNIGTNIKAPTKIPILKCPEILEMRQLLQFQPITEEMRQKLMSALRDFASEVLNRMQAESLLAIEDPRSQEEKHIVQELKMLADTFKLAAKKYEIEHLKPVYEQAMAPPPPCPPSKPPPKGAKPDSDQDRKKKEDEEARRTIKRSIFESYFESELGKVFVEKMARGLDDDTQNRGADSEANRFSFFDPTDIKHCNSPASNKDKTDHHPSQQSESLDSGVTDKKHPKNNMLSEKSEPVLSNYVKKENQNLAQIYSASRGYQPVAPGRHNKPSEKSEPLLSDYLKKENQNVAKHSEENRSHRSTPHRKHSASSEKTVSVLADYLKQQLEKLTVIGPHRKEQSNLRMNVQFKKSVLDNLHREQQKLIAGFLDKRGERQLYNPFDRTDMRKIVIPSRRLSTIQPAKVASNTDGESDSVRSANNPSKRNDVYGNPRTESRIVLPAAIQGGKPGAHPNLKFNEIEEPVRQQIKTSSVAGGNVKSMKRLNRMRGLIVYPQKVDYGTLVEGNVYTFLVTLTNTGIDACRFKVRRPPSSSGLTVKHTVGSIAAGMSVDLNLELYAMAGDKDTTTGATKYSYALQIVTETDFLELPLLANVLTAEEYKNSSVAPQIKRFTNARILTKKSNQAVKKRELSVK